MMFERLRTADSRKKLLGALVVIAFVAFFASVLTRYIVVSELNLALIAFAVVFLILFLLLAIETRKGRKAKVKSMRKRKARRRK